MDKEVLVKDKEVLEHQLRLSTVELTVMMASANQAENEKARMEATSAKQHYKATKEIQSLKELLNKKEVYAGELVQEFTQAKEDLCVFFEKIKFLESSLEPLKISYDAAEARKQIVRAEVDQPERE